MLYRNPHRELLCIYCKRRRPRLLLRWSEKNGRGMCRRFLSHSCGFMEEMLHVSASSQSCSLYINAALKGTNNRYIDLPLFVKKEKNAPMSFVYILQLFLRRPCHAQTYAVVEFYQYIISHIWPIFHFDGSCLTKPHSVWVHLMEIISWVHLHTMAWIINIAVLSPPASGCTAPEPEQSLRKDNTVKLSQPLVSLDALKP